MVEKENQERDAYINRLFTVKPWLKQCIGNLKASKLPFIQKNYPINEDDMQVYEQFIKNRDGNPDQKSFDREVEFI